MKRKEALKNLLETAIFPEDLVVSSLGRLSRELYELRLARNEKPDDFYVMGSMGCALPIALGVALNTEKRVFLLTGDGAFLMKFGAIATFMNYYPLNLFIVILNNDSHESCGGQPTNFKEIREWLNGHCKIIDIQSGTHKDLKRIPIPPQEIVKNFREKLHSKI